jgi:transposase
MGWPAGKPLGSRARQPKREDHEAGGPRGYDAGKKVRGRKRHVLVDTDGRALVLPGPCCLDPGSRRRLAAAQDLAPSLPFYRMRLRGQRLRSGPGSHATRIAVEIVRKLPDQIGFAVHPRRWVVERFFAWINRN